MRQGWICVLAMALIAGCNGGESPTSPPPSQQPIQLLVQGTTQSTGPSTCSGDSHDFESNGGLIVVTLLQSTANTPLMLQVCAKGTTTNCSIALQKVDVGSGTIGSTRGGAMQTLKFQPLNCGGNGPAPSTPISYAAHVANF